jgi:hypothetical protein
MDSTPREGNDVDLRRVIANPFKRAERNQRKGKRTQDNAYRFNQPSADE